MIETRDSHIMLLEFIAAEDDELLRMIFAQHEFDEFLAERARAAGDQHNLFRPIDHFASCKNETKLSDAALFEHLSIVHNVKN